MNHILNRKDNKKVTKLTSQVPYHEGRGEKGRGEKDKTTNRDNLVEDA